MVLVMDPNESDVVSITIHHVKSCEKYCVLLFSFFFSLFSCMLWRLNSHSFSQPRPLVSCNKQMWIEKMHMSRWKQSIIWIHLFIYIILCQIGFKYIDWFKCFLFLSLCSKVYSTLYLIHIFEQIWLAWATSSLYNLLL